MNLRSFVYLAPLVMIATLANAADKPTEPPIAQAHNPTSADVSLSIHGNQEQPTVLYIVPWQEAKDNTPLQSANKPAIKQVFKQLERDEHQRHTELTQPPAPQDSSTP